MPNQGTDSILKASKVPGVRTVFILTVFAITGTVLGFLREVTVAFFFGTSAAADAYAVIIHYYDFFFVFMLSGAAGLAVIPFLAKKREEDSEETGVGVVIALGGWFTMGAFVASLVIVIYAESITRAMLPGLTAEQFSLTSSMLRLCAFGIAPLILTTIMLALLQSYYQFNVVPFARISMNSSIIIFTVVLSGIVSIYGAGIGILAGIAIQLCLALLFFYRIRLPWRVVSPFDTELIALLKAMVIPLLVVTIANFLYGYIELYLLSGLGVGKVSGVKYAARLTSIVMGLSVSIQTVFFARLGRTCSDNDDSQKIALLDKTLRMGTLVLAPASFLLATISRPLVQLLFERGSFGSESTAITSVAFGIYALGVVGGFVWGMVVRAGFIFGTNSVSLITVIILLLSGTAFNFLTISALGYIAIPIGYSLAAWIAALIGLVILGLRIRKVIAILSVIIYIIKVTFFAFVCALPIWLLGDQIYPLAPDGFLGNMVGIVIIGIAYVVLFGGIAWLLDFANLRGYAFEIAKSLRSRLASED